MMPFVPFGRHDFDVAIACAERRQDSNAERGNTARLQGPGLREHKVGALGEWAVVRWFDCEDFWNDYTDEEDVRHTGDVGDYEVRTTEHPRGGLLLRDRDDPERIYICVRVTKKGGTLVGWLRGKDGMIPRWWRTDVRYPCWIVSASALQPMEEIRNPKEGP